MQVFFIVGPTASGKSRWAQEWAEAAGGEILNADSVQVYERVQIGAAKPTQEEMKRVRHHLVGVIPPPERLTAGGFRREALAALEDANSRGVKSVFVVGGSGFYLLALEKGMFELGPVSSAIQGAVEEQAATQEGLSRLFEELRSQDEVYARKIGPKDRYRISRAVEILREFGSTPTLLRERFAPEPFPYPMVKIGLEPERDQLRQQIKERTKRMFQEGLVEEVQDLMGQGLGDWAPLQSVGYKEVAAFLGKTPSASQTLAECEALVVQNTQRLAKRQRTWFHRDTDILWFDPAKGRDRPDQIIWSKISR